MVAPITIGPPDSTDPLLLLPLPSKLPPSPSPTLESLLAALDPLLDSSKRNETPNQPVLPPALLTSQMRLVMRNAQILLNASREKAVRARETLDKEDTALRGVEYERARIREEIELCDEYAPAYTALELEEGKAFYESAGEEVKSSLPQPEDADFPHALIIAQLEQELQALERREETVTTLTKDRDALIRSKKDIKHKFDSLDTWLHDYQRTTGILVGKVRDSAKSTTPPLSALAKAMLAEAPAVEAEEVLEELAIAEAVPAIHGDEAEAQVEEEVAADGESVTTPATQGNEPAPAGDEPEAGKEDADMT